MTTIEIKSNFHKLIDSIDNDIILQSFYKILSGVTDSHEGILWNSLTNEKQEELFQIEKDSYNSSNLISHSKMLKKQNKWLSK